ncbi:SDR family oxidoreductase [Aquabacter spiritensis]|uniref:Nucleoside-diphosphate-sugar epimerase n=1 Tax=Aquabacter spiritensis TaxID=933073 RepID=A0A4R3LLD0_9HYPH|nr:SDR family oxidoreductase [Aquabacter spiritensis]TCT01102.1 nucleoside-diphosphate-sugar epimerase [Aquabacter spiritensis]
MTVALVVGATGVTGAPLCEQLLRAGWRVHALSRRVPQLASGTPVQSLFHLPVDLDDGARTHAALADLGAVTHVFYCANSPSAEARKEMIGSLLDGLETLPHFTNINFIQGMKYYGCHLGPFPTPAKETDPRVPGCDFYYTEEDMIQARQAGQAWTWTTLRPHSVCGLSAGNPVNVASAVAVYASMQRALGDTLAFPGTDAAFRSLFQVADAGLLARAAIHVSTLAQGRNRAFNINNGDYFRWQTLWPSIAAFFGLKPGGPSGASLTAFFEEQKPVWDALVRDHRLAPFPYDRLPRWSLGEYQPPNSRLACTYDVIADTVRLRQAGFCEAIDSGAMFQKIFGQLRAERLIP